MTEQELLKSGYILDPVTKQVVLIADLAKETPEEGWSEERLIAYARSNLDQVDDLLQKAILIGRRGTICIFRAGHALSIMRDRLKEDGRWLSWQKESNLPRTTVWEAIELFTKAKTEQAISEMTPSEAKEAFGIVKSRMIPKPTENTPSAALSLVRPATEGDGSPIDPPSDETATQLDGSHPPETDDETDTDGGDVSEEGGNEDPTFEDLERHADDDLKRLQDRLRLPNVRTLSIAVRNGIWKLANDLAEEPIDEDLKSTISDIGEAAHSLKELANGN